MKSLKALRACAVAGALATAGMAGIGLAASPASAQTTVTVPYTCTFPILGAESVNVGITETAPASVAPGATFNLTGVQSTTVIPGSLTSTLVLIESSLSGTVNTFDVNAQNATPATLNGAATPISFGPIPLTSGQPASVVAPATPETVGPFTAGSSGSVVLSPGDINIETDLSGTAYNVPCTPPTTIPTADEITIPINSTSIPVGTVGGIGLAAVAGAGLVWRQRRRSAAMAAA